MNEVAKNGNLGVGSRVMWFLRLTLRCILWTTSVKYHFLHGQRCPGSCEEIYIYRILHLKWFQGLRQALHLPLNLLHHYTTTYRFGGLCKPLVRLLKMPNPLGTAHIFLECVTLLSASTSFFGKSSKVSLLCKGFWVQSSHSDDVSA